MPTFPATIRNNIPGGWPVRLDRRDGPFEPGQTKFDPADTAIPASLKEQRNHCRESDAAWRMGCPRLVRGSFTFVATPADIPSPPPRSPAAAPPPLGNGVVGGGAFECSTEGDRCRASFVKLAAAEVAVDAEVIKKDVGRVLLKLEELQDQQIADALTPRDRARKLSDRDHDAALELLKDPNLLQRITADFDACGVVGEETNRLAGYLAATSRKLDKPLAVLIQSSSSAGKTSLMDSVLRFMPPEEQVTLLHQYQRPIRTATCSDETIQYIEVTPQDIAVANGLAAEVLGRTLDELSPQARRLLILLHNMVSQKCRELAIDRSAGSPAPTSARLGI